MPDPIYTTESPRHLSDLLWPPGEAGPDPSGYAQRARELEEQQAFDLHARRLGIRDHPPDPNWMGNLIAQEGQRQEIYHPVAQPQDWLEFWRNRAATLNPREVRPAQLEVARAGRSPLDRGAEIREPVERWEANVGYAQTELDAAKKASLVRPIQRAIDATVQVARSLGLDLGQPTGGNVGGEDASRRGEAVRRMSMRRIDRRLGQNGGAPMKARRKPSIPVSQGEVRD